MIKKLPNNQAGEKLADPPSRAKIIESAEMQRKKTQKQLMDKFLNDRPGDAAKLLKAWLIDEQGDNPKS